eukprot:4621052-Alexandrium_andersonii.AAC.1
MSASDVVPEYISHVSYVDDALFILDDATSDSLLERSALMVREVCAQFTVHGLRVNLSKGKSEVMFAFRGHRSKAVRAQVDALGGLSVELW